MRRKYTLTRAVIVIVVCLTIFLAVLIDNSSVCTESCSVSLEDLTFPVRIILLSDLHGKSFGRDVRGKNQSDEKAFFHCH